MALTSRRKTRDAEVRSGAYVPCRSRTVTDPALQQGAQSQTRENSDGDCSSLSRIVPHRGEPGLYQTGEKPFNHPEGHAHRTLGNVVEAICCSPKPQILRQEWKHDRDQDED